MKFIEYNIAKPPFDGASASSAGLTYAAAVRAKLQMIIYDRESAPAKVVKEIKEQEVYMGRVPPDRPTVRSSSTAPSASSCRRCTGRRACSFEHDKGKTHSSGKLLFSLASSPTAARG